jgi:hypothetical protein
MVLRVDCLTLDEIEGNKRSDSSREESVKFPSSVNAPTRDYCPQVLHRTNIIEGRGSIGSNDFQNLVPKSHDNFLIGGGDQVEDGCNSM